MAQYHTVTNKSILRLLARNWRLVLGAPPVWGWIGFGALLIAAGARTSGSGQFILFLSGGAWLFPALLLLAVVLILRKWMGTVEFHEARSGFRDELDAGLYGPEFPAPLPSNEFLTDDF